MILDEIRFLVGIHLADKGLPPTVIAPVINIMNILDSQLSQMAFEPLPELETEMKRLSQAIILMNASKVSFLTKGEDDLDDDDVDFDLDDDEDDNDEDIFFTVDEDDDEDDEL